MISIAFVLSFVGAALVFILSIIIFAEVSDSINETFPAPLLINTNGTGFTSITSIDHAYDEQTVNQVRSHPTTNIYSTIPGISLSSGEFIPGDKYLIIIRADMKGTSVAGNPNDYDGSNYSVKSLHGSTDFEGSEFNWSHRGGIRDIPYHYMTVWTAVGGESITMQTTILNFASNDATKEVHADQITITAISLEDFIEDEDWFYDVRTATDTLECLNFHLSTCPIVGDWTQTNPSITFTTNGSDDWLVMATSYINPNSNGDVPESRLNLDDTILTPSQRDAADERGDDGDISRHTHFLTRVYTPSESSHTVETEAAQPRISTNPGNGPAKREYSQIFAINLDKFEYHNDNYVPSFNTPPHNDPGGSFGFLANGQPKPPPVLGNIITLDSPSAEDTFIMAFHAHSNPSGTSDPRARMQIHDGSGVNFTLDPSTNEGYKDQPPTQTADIHNYGPMSSNSFVVWTMNTMENLPTTFPLNSGVVDVRVDSYLSFGASDPRLDGQVFAISMSAKTFEYEDQVPVAFNRSSAIVFTVLGILPIAMFFALFALFSPRVDGEI